MRRSLNRVAALRRTLHRHAELLLGMAQQKLVVAEEARDGLGELLVEQAATGALPLSVLELAQLATGAADRSVSELRRERERCADEERRRALDRRQMERLVERADSEARAAENRRAQKLLDDWTVARRSRR